MESMFRKLEEVEENLPRLLSFPDTYWQSLDIVYEPPHVERLWVQEPDCRIYLHCIHPANGALFHPHPWPSAVKILQGGYEMGVGYRNGEEIPVVATMFLPPGSRYEMVDPKGWHYVKVPEGSISLSLMVTGLPWGSPGKGRNQSPLGLERKIQLLNQFREFYGQ